MKTDFKMIETNYGHLAIPGEQDLISRFLVKYGEWAPYEHVLANLFLKDDDILIDAGAYLGTFTLGCSQLKPTANIICVEANRKILPFLEHNLEKNLSQTYYVIDKAIGINSGEVFFASDKYNLGGAHVTKDKEGSGQISVLTTNLKAIRKQYGDYQFIKMDIEGCELEALKQDQGYLHKAKPVIFIEANETMHTCKIANYCRWLGYNVFYVSVPCFRTRNDDEKVDPIFALAHEALLIALPPSVTMDCLPEEIESDGGFLVAIDNSHTLIDALWKTPRWSNKKWLECNYSQLVAVLSRYHNGETYKDFVQRLMPDKPF